MSKDQQSQRRRRVRGKKFGKGEILLDSRGRVVDDTYVESAVEDAMSEVAQNRPEDKS